MKLQPDLKWTDELANELHKPVVRHFRKRKVYVGGIDDIWAADLIDMQAFAKDNDGVKYLVNGYRCIFKIRLDCATA